MSSAESLRLQAAAVAELTRLRRERSRRRVRKMLVSLTVLVVLIVGGLVGYRKFHDLRPSVVTNGVAHEWGLRDASRDVRVSGPIVVNPEGFAETTVTVTNHSRDTSDYIITVVLDSANGVTQVDSSVVSVNVLAAGQSSVQVVTFVGSTKLPSRLDVRVQGVDRTSSVG